MSSDPRRSGGNTAPPLPPVREHTAPGRRRAGAWRIYVPAGLVILVMVGIAAAVFVNRGSDTKCAGANCDKASTAIAPDASLANPSAASASANPSASSSLGPAATASAPASASTSRKTPVRAVDATGGGRYPARFSVGAPGVGRYAQSDAHLKVPAGYTEVQPHDKTAKEWALRDCKGTVNIDHKYFHAYIYIAEKCYGKVNITNTIIAPPPGSANRAILVNTDTSGKLQLNLSNVTIRPEPEGLGAKGRPLNDFAINDCSTCTLSLNRVDVANTGGMCFCGGRTTIRNSWLHDNYIANLADPGELHSGGVFPYGGSGPITIENSRLEPGIDAAKGKPVPNYWKAITAVLFTQAAEGSKLRNYTVRNSFLSLGGYSFDPEDGEGMRLTDNVFGPSHWDYMPGECRDECTVTFSEWSNNVVGTMDGVPTKKQLKQPW
jgi:hypothetical protein